MAISGSVVGSGPLTIVTNADISRSGTPQFFDTGISGSSNISSGGSSGDGDVSITSNGKITGFTTGISVRRNVLGGSGNFEIHANGDITTPQRSQAIGISASIQGGSGNITIDGTGNITGIGGFGIEASHAGTAGNISITGSGNVSVTSSTTSPFALAFAGISASMLAGGANNGNILIARTGTIAVDRGTGIFARTDGAGNITINALNTVTGGSFGIEARAAGGPINITVDADVRAPNFGGVGILITGGAGNTVVNNATIFGGSAGLGAQGNTTVTNRGTIGTNGIAAVNFSGGGNTLIMEGPLSQLDRPGARRQRRYFPSRGNRHQQLQSRSDLSPIRTFGFGTYQKTDGGTWTLTGTGKANQNWTIGGGTLVGNSTSIQGTAITNNAALIFDQAGNGTYAGAIGGSGVADQDRRGNADAEGGTPTTAAPRSAPERSDRRRRNDGLAGRQRDQQQQLELQPLRHGYIRRRRFRQRCRPAERQRWR